MMTIILESKVNPPEKGQVHHIVPRCWYKHYNMEVDNSISNTVLLTLDNHKKVHSLAYKCSKEPWLKQRLAYACHRFGEKTPDWHPTEETKKKLAESHKRENLSAETIQKFRENAIKNKPRLGTKTTEEARKNLSNAQKKYLKNEENRLKCGIKFKGKTWVKINGKRVWRDK